MNAPLVELSIVIPAFNAEATLGEQLSALSRQAWSGTWEVIVVDNGSSDGTRRIATSFASKLPALRVIDGSGERGPSFARNFGAAHAGGRSLAFCDADDVVGARWLASIGDALRSATFVTGPQEQTLLNPPWAQGVYGKALERDMQTFAGVFPFGPSANLGVRSETFLAVGGFDPRLRVGEDLDLCLRLWHVGTDLVFVPGALVHYRNRGTIRALFTQSRTYGAAAPEIVRRIRALQHDVPAQLRGAKNWLWLVRNLPTVRHRAGRARWAVVAGASLGRLIGSARARTVYL